MAVLFRSTDGVAVDHPLYGRYATIAPGVPGRCPHCDAFGRIVHADLSRHLQNQRCLECEAIWQYEFDADGRIMEVRTLTEPRDDPHATDGAQGAGVVDLRDEARTDSVDRRHISLRRLLQRS